MSSRRRWDAHCKRGRIAASREFLLRDHARIAQSALDVIRREKVFRGKEAEIARLIEASDPPQAKRRGFSQNEIADDRCE
jgi:uncharacterized protein (DUF1778 family)